MIKGINGGKYIVVSGGSPSPTYVNNYGGGHMVGQMRYNTSSQNVEVYDGNNWVMMASSFAQVELDHEAQMLLSWAREEKNRQLQRESRIKSNPALRKAYEAIQRAEENFDILDRIVGEDVGDENEQVQASP